MQHSLEKLVDKAKRNQAIVRSGKEGYVNANVFLLMDLPEIDEAWQSLELFPARAIIALGSLKSDLPIASELHTRLHQRETWLIQEREMENDPLLLAIGSSCWKIEICCVNLSHILREAIDQFRENAKFM